MADPNIIPITTHSNFQQSKSNFSVLEMPKYREALRFILGCESQPSFEAIANAVPFIKSVLGAERVVVGLKREGHI